MKVLRFGTVSILALVLFLSTRSLLAQGFDEADVSVDNISIDVEYQQFLYAVSERLLREYAEPGKDLLSETQPSTQLENYFLQMPPLPNALPIEPSKISKLPVPTPQPAKAELYLCVYDDFSIGKSGYAQCRSKNELDCLNAFPCVWDKDQSQCKPRTQAACEEFSKKWSGASENWVESEVEFLLQSMEDMTGRLKKYSSIRFDRVGPEIRVAGWSTEVSLVSLAASSMTSMTARDFAADFNQKTNLDDLKADVAVTEGWLALVQDRAKRKMAFPDISISANQFHAPTEQENWAALLDRSYDFGAAATMLELRISDRNPVVPASVSVKEGGSHICKYESDDNFRYRLTRFCSPLLGDDTAYCTLSDGTKAQEICKYVSFGSAQFARAVKPSAPKVWYGVDSSTGKPVQIYTYAEAKKLCADSGSRLPAYSELRQLIETKDLYNTFGAGQGWAWTGDAAKKPGQHVIYSFDAICEGGVSAAGIADDTSKGYLICAK